MTETKSKAKAKSRPRLLARPSAEVVEAGQACGGRFPKMDAVLSGQACGGRCARVVEVHAGQACSGRCGKAVEAHGLSGRSVCNCTLLTAFALPLACTSCGVAPMRP